MMPSVLNAVSLNPSILIGAVLNFTCNLGFIMPGNLTSINTTCMADGNWSVDVSNISCQRKSSLHLIIMINVLSNLTNWIHRGVFHEENFKKTYLNYSLSQW